MHELLLYGQVPPGRRSQVLNVLAGLTAMQPVPVLEKHVIFKPSAERMNKAQKARLPQQGGSQRIVDPHKAAALARAAKIGFDDTHFWHLRRAILGASGDVDGGEASGMAGPDHIWTKQMHETPDPGINSHILRHVSYEDVELSSADKLQDIMRKDGLDLALSYTLRGDRFVLENTALLLFQLHTESSGDPEKLGDSYVLEAKIKLADGTNPRLVKLGQQELDVFRERMRGIVEMKAPERLCMDTRAR